MFAHGSADSEVSPRRLQGVPASKADSSESYRRNDDYGLEAATEYSGQFPEGLSI
jgi:hypothetical protein